MSPPCRIDFTITETSFSPLRAHGKRHLVNGFMPILGHFAHPFVYEGRSVACALATATTGARAPTMPLDKARFPNTGLRSE